MNWQLFLRLSLVSIAIAQSIFLKILSGTKNLESK